LDDSFTQPLLPGCACCSLPCVWLGKPGSRNPTTRHTRLLIARSLRADGVQYLRNFTELRQLVSAWDGASPAVDVWLSAEQSARAEARRQLESMVELMRSRVSNIRTQQISAVKLRLQEELGRFLVCAEPDTDDLNGKLHRMTEDRNATADRLRRVFHRLGEYPDWPSAKLQALRSLRNEMSVNQIKTRLTGRELDAAMDDPRWTVR
jgi:hypothetical protein